ncbi:hypothetical protein BH24ACT12_BH24ACT12_10870 [soil metagenome]
MLGVPGGRFSVDGGHESRLRLPFTGDPATFREAVARLARAYADALAGSGPTTRDRRPLIA